MKYAKQTFLAVASLLLASSTSWSETLRFAVFSAPPFMILGEEGAPESRYSGIDLDIAREIARRMRLDVSFEKCPWARCLQWLQEGRVDFLSSAYKKPDREVFLEYFRQPYLASLPIAFYFKRESKYEIEKYEDISSRMKIGVLRNASYFEQFDQDKNLSKYEVTTQDQLFPMLMFGRVDLVAGYVPTENYRLVVEGYKGKIEKSLYEYSGRDPVFMALGKKSPFIERMQEFNRINDELISEGFIKKTVDGYYNKYLP